MPRRRNRSLFWEDVSSAGVCCNRCVLPATFGHRLQVCGARRPRRLDERDGPGEKGELFQTADLHGAPGDLGDSALACIGEASHAARAQQRLKSLTAVGQPQPLAADASRWMVFQRVYPVASLGARRVVGHRHSHGTKKASELADASGYGACYADAATDVGCPGVLAPVLQLLLCASHVLASVGLGTGTAGASLRARRDSLGGGRVKRGQPLRLGQLLKGRRQRFGVGA